MITEVIFGLLIIIGIIIFAIKNRKVKNENPEASATGLPLPTHPKRDSPN